MPREKPSAKFSLVPACAVDDRRLGDAALRILITLCAYRDQDGWCFPAVSTLAKRSGKSRQAVQRQLKILEGLGYIEIHPQTRPNGGNTANRYRVNNVVDIGAKESLLIGYVTPDQGSNHMLPSPCNMTLRGGPPDVLRPLQPCAAPPATSEVASISELTTQLSTTERTNRNTYSVAFEKFWSVFPGRGPYSNPKSIAWKLFRRYVESGVDPEDIIAGARAYANYIEQTETDDQFVAQAKTWLSQHRWTDWIESGSELHDENGEF